MNFATVTQTIDWFEIVLVVAGVVWIAVAALCVRESWREFLWGIRDRRVSMRLLGVVQITTSALLLTMAAVVEANTFAQFLVPSAINTGEDVLDVVAAISSRMTYIAVITMGATVCAMMAWWRRVADRLRREDGPREASPEVMAQTPEHDEYGAGSLARPAVHAPAAPAAPLIVPRPLSGEPPAAAQGAPPAPVPAQAEAP